MLIILESHDPKVRKPDDVKEWAKRLLPLWSWKGRKQTGSLKGSKVRIRRIQYHIMIFADLQGIRILEDSMAMEKKPVPLSR